MALFDADQAGFMQGPVSLNVGACDLDGAPSVARAVGCRIAPDRGNVRILLSRTQGALVLAHVREHGAIAVVFSDPATHRALQVKGRDAVVAEAGPEDLAVVARYRETFPALLAPYGYAPEMVTALLHCPEDDLVAVAFTPSAAFVQTPGPGAGAVLGAAS